MKRRLSFHLTAAALIFQVLSGCGDADSDDAPMNTGGTSGAGGAGGATGGGIGERGGNTGEAGATPGSGGISQAGAGGAEPGGPGGLGGAAGVGGTDGASEAGAGGQRTTDPQGVCTKDAQCDDHAFCNGVELCLDLFPGSDLKVCKSPLRGPCPTDACDEEARRCDCSDGDKDGDGYKAPGCAKSQALADCDDDDGTRRPGLQESCDADQPGHDEDCREATIAGTEGDRDGDGFVDTRCSNLLPYQVLGTPEDKLERKAGSDCNDESKDFHPNAPELCDNADNNCNGQVDELAGLAPGDEHTYYLDRDDDQFGDSSSPKQTRCGTPPAGYALLDGDCDDTNRQVTPERGELCNGIDDNCDGITDLPATPGTLMIDEPFGDETKYECKAGHWGVTQCPPDRLDCDEDFLTACETPSATLCNCRECGRTCSFSCGQSGCEEIQSARGGRLHTCFLIKPTEAQGQGSVACVGRNASGQLGTGNTKNISTAALVLDLQGVSAIAVGDAHSCALVGAGNPYCWGDNGVGQLGTGSSERPSPFASPVADFYNRKASAIGAGSFHSCAVYGSERYLACWGQGASGQLGDDRDDDHTNRVPIGVRRKVENQSQAVTDASQVVGGWLHTCAILAGKVECWGDNSSMQLGLDPESVPKATTPRLVPGLESLQIDELAAAELHTCARAGTKVYCWGNNEGYQLASEQGEMGPPTPIALPDDIVAIAAGVSFGCALRPNGKVLCWGDVPGATDPTVAPHELPIRDAVGIYAGHGHHLCAVKRDGSTWCLGQSDFGQLGNGTTEQQSDPSRVLPLSGSQACLTAN